MRKLHQDLLTFNLFTLFFCIALSKKGITQSCSAPLEAMTAKYWQYRDNFNKHFILNDRDSSGCVGDGIGQQASDSCEFFKAGYGLPATSIIMFPNGGHEMRDRNKSAEAARKCRTQNMPGKNKSGDDPVIVGFVFSCVQLNCETVSTLQQILKNPETL